ncbi:BQ2448_652 [Microbotryum intermedium]|uniref:BQ2448_652 protein n=1 Tax=Microbotryum intermedium TaxID=269621 RepID=A0A238F8V3_9BASI|nr:BQ2448_652 [Microbotryum intermedium]
MRSVTLNGWNTISSTSSKGASPPPTPPEKASSTSHGLVSPAIVTTQNEEELDDEDLQALKQVQATLLSLGIDPSINQVRRQDDALQLKGEALAALTLPTNQVDGEWLERVRSRSRQPSADIDDDRRYSAESWIGRAGDLLSPVLDEPPNGSVLDRDHGFGREEDQSNMGYAKKEVEVPSTIENDEAYEAQVSGLVMGRDEAQGSHQPARGILSTEEAKAVEAAEDSTSEAISVEVPEGAQTQEPVVVVTEAAEEDEPTTAAATESADTADKNEASEEAEQKTSSEETTEEGCEEEEKKSDSEAELVKGKGKKGRNPKPVKAAPPKRPPRTPRIGTAANDGDSTQKASDDELDSPSSDLTKEQLVR